MISRGPFQHQLFQDYVGGETFIAFKKFCLESGNLSVATFLRYLPWSLVSFPHFPLNLPMHLHIELLMGCVLSISAALLPHTLSPPPQNQSFLLPDFS